MTTDLLPDPAAQSPVRTVTESPRRWAVGSAAAVGVVAGAILTDRPSVAYLAVGVAAVLAARLPDRSRWSVAWIGAAFALLLVPFVRDSGWLAASSVGLAVWCVALSTTRSTTFTATVLAPIVPVVVQGAVLRSLGTGAAQVTLPSRGSAVRTLRVVVSTALLVTVFTLLFAGADDRFASLVDAVIPTVSVDVDPLGPVVALCVALWILGVAHAKRRAMALDALAPGAGRRRPVWEWAVPVCALVVVFAAFVVVQAATLFGGHDHVMTTDDLTFADHARSGFWQLITVTVGVLVVVAVQVRKVDAEVRRDRVLARIAFGSLCVLTLVVVWSAVYRMSLYEQQFGLTRLRVGVMVVEVWLGVVVLAVIVAGARWSARLLPAVIVGTAALGVLVMAVVNVDALVAERAVERYERTGLIDVDYLGTLSADAVPAVSTLPPTLRDCIVDEPGSDPWWNANLARREAAVIAASDPLAECALPAREAGR
ncbi:DUF4153 domain-containing protein [Rhodococcus sp. UNC23MFCrub1.1]|uniref:DUF4153 domain-containing protein n=1 Tax=Rhodococcus sp. UNC23MFCrub1.1 TaxID=1449068 RepID=UPI00068D2DB8|nr:DUF4173 domain-containing protein [Rhodococcus sp. UNC23MFCrub1.1]